MCWNHGKAPCHITLSFQTSIPGNRSLPIWTTRVLIVIWNALRKKRKTRPTLKYSSVSSDSVRNRLQRLSEIFWIVNYPNNERTTRASRNLLALPKLLLQTVRITHNTIRNLSYDELISTGTRIVICLILFVELHVLNLDFIIKAVSHFARCVAYKRH